MYINGSEISSDSLPGDFSDWFGGADKKFGIASSYTGRNWLGVFYYTGIYNRALSSAEINHNYSLGAGPISFISAMPKDAFSIEGQTATFSVFTYNPTPDPFDFQWQKNGVDISGATSSEYITDDLTLADDNTTI